ncbi:Uncharacterised protein [uncultured archaeon]|nr:Uncharacterised protein [uncultured archaeon]
MTSNNNSGSLLDISTVPIVKLFAALAAQGDAFKFAAQNGRAFIARDEHATLSAPFSVTL